MKLHLRSAAFKRTESLSILKRCYFLFMCLLLTASLYAGKGFCEDDLSTTAEEIPNGPVPEGQWQLTANTFSLKVLLHLLYLLYLLYLSHLVFRAAGANACSTHSAMSKFSGKFCSRVSSKVKRRLRAQATSAQRSSSTYIGV